MQKAMTLGLERSAKLLKNLAPFDNTLPLTSRLGRKPSGIEPLGCMVAQRLSLSRSTQIDFTRASPAAK
jgi:hypothetical protein